MFGINYVGLRQKKTYDELIDDVMNKQEKYNIQTEPHNF